MTKRHLRRDSTLCIPIELTYIQPHMLKPSQQKVLMTTKGICNRCARVHCCTACHQNLQASIRSVSTPPKSAHKPLFDRRRQVGTDCKHDSHRLQTRQPCASVICSSRLATAECRQTTHCVSRTSDFHTDLDHIICSVQSPQLLGIFSSSHQQFVDSLSPEHASFISI